MATKRRDSESALRRLAEKIRSRREELHLTQEDVAGAAGVSVRHYQKVEGGSIDLRFTSLVAVVHALRTSIGTLAD